MPTTLFGCSTALYGETDRRPDGSYVATTFICVFAIPLLPLASLRIMRDKKKDNNGILFGKLDILY